jgi:aminoglycoside phosphotransferase family enzyme
MVSPQKFAYPMPSKPQPKGNERVLSHQAVERQATLIAKLTNPNCYSHPTAAVKHLETHISHILLVGDYAYKIKKPLDLGFLDFTSLAQRKFYCAEEVRLNRRLAADLYLGYMPICGSEENPLLDGNPNDAIEYAVKMRRFSQTQLLDHCLDEGFLKPHHLDELARQLADFHLTIIHHADTETPFGTPDKVHQPALDNFTQSRPLLKSAEDILVLNQLEDWTKAVFGGLKDTFAGRKAAGFIRECHGDLHLGNMLLEKDRIVIFDGIEFNDDFRWIDVMNDLGFLTMDLHKRHASKLAWQILNSYLELTGDYPGLSVLPYYQVYRAMVRAKIAAIRLQQPGLTDAQRSTVQGECGEYLRLAQGFTQPPTPFLLITHGVSGSGKSFFTHQLKEALGAIRIRSDVERKRLYGLPPLAASHSEPNQGLYTQQASERTYQHLYQLAEQMLNVGYRVMVDATFLDPKQRQTFRALAERLKVPFILLACSADPITLHERVTKRKAQGEDAAEADSAVLEHQLANYQAPLPQEHPLYTKDYDIDNLPHVILTRLIQ